MEGSRAWYDALKKSQATPSPIVFDVVWKILYTLLALSLVLFMRKGGSTLGLVAFSVQLMLNILWPVLFFSYRRTCWTTFVIVVMMAATVVTGVEFFNVNKVSFFVLIPYAAWITFALYLNAYICVAN